MKELNRNSLYYRGLGDLTYNECVERKCKILKSTLLSLLGITIWLLLILTAGNLLGYESEFSRGYFAGAMFSAWFVACVELISMYAYANKKFDLRLKEIEG